MSERRFLGLLGCGLVLLVLTASGLYAQRGDDIDRFVALALAQGAVYLVAIWLIRRSTASRRAVILILGIAVAMRIAVLAAPPFLSSDVYRYVWDGRVLAAGYGSACLVNADSPTLPTGVLVAAAHALAPPGDRLVLGPAEDGGYYLIGVKYPHRRLFEEIEWSTERVFRQTLDRAAELGLDTVTLGAWYDVDDVASLRRLVAELGSPRPAGYAAPYTAAFLRMLAAHRLVARL